MWNPMQYIQFPLHTVAYYLISMNQQKQYHCSMMDVKDVNIINVISCASATARQKRLVGRKCF